jgi:polysaccharide pyruvyl transferase WcaK-like protein
LVYLPHVSRYDLDAPQIFGAHDGKTRFDLARVAPWMYPERSDNVPALIGTYGQCDLVLGMRGHSNIFSFAQGIPFIALGDHPKNTYFAESVGAPVVFNDCTNLLQVLKDTLADSELINKQNALRHESRLTLEAFAKECIRVILRETS